MNRKKYQQHPNYRTALRNEHFYEILLNGDDRYHFWEWMLTVLFYTSLHYIKAFLAIKHHLPPGRIDSHRGIQKELHRLKKQGHLPKKILTKYEQFKNHSELARYHYLENYSDFNDDEFVKFVQNSCYKKYILIREYVLQELQNTP